MEEKNNRKKFPFAFLAGLIAGIVAGLLFAPRKGSQLRRQLKKKMIKNKILKEVIAKMEAIEKASKEKYFEILEEVSGFYRQAKKIKEEDLKEIIADLKNRWEEIKLKLKTKK